MKLLNQKKKFFLDKMSIANLGKQHRRFLDSQDFEFFIICVFIWSYKLLYHTIYIA